MFNKYKKYILLSIGGIFLIGFVCLYLSINKDPNAAIFDISHYGIVGDVFKVVPRLIEKIKESRDK